MTKRSTKVKPIGHPVVFGEVLFDCFDDGYSVLGGAPFNVAWHLHGFGMVPMLISRVGDDDLGTQVLESMERWGMETRGVQVDREHPTGTVQVRLSSAGDPAFDILPAQAYDHIDAMAASAAINEGQWNLLYHGSLATRDPNASSLEALAQLRTRFGLSRFVDVNLRPPWWEREAVIHSLSGASWVKLNNLELTELSGRVPNADPLERTAHRFRKQLGIELLILTLGGEGAVLAGKDQTLRSRPGKVENLADTVGAGDAFAAVTILGLSLGWPLRYILRRAVDFAAAICGIRGATSLDRDLYLEYLERWKE